MRDLKSFGHPLLFVCWVIFQSADFFMPPTLKKLKGHIALGLSVRPFLCASVTKIKLQF